MNTKLVRNDVLVFDIETDSLSTDTANLVYFGAYSYITKKRYILRGHSQDVLNQIQNIFETHSVIVGFNHLQFDMPILNRYGIFCHSGTIHIDLWTTLSPPHLDLKTRTRSGGKGRGSYMGLNLNSWTLANIIKELNLGEYKIEGFDYSLLTKTERTIEEENIIITYLDQDITITKRLFEFTNNFFHPFAEYLSEANVRRFCYITSSIAALAYKIICHEANLVEEYDDNETIIEYPGGYVRYPTKEKYVGIVACFDFKSLYPNIFRTFNLFSPIGEDDKNVFGGNEFFQIRGRYKKDKQGIVEEAIGKLYKKREEYKNINDRREYLIKIILNSIYGASAKPVFKSIYSEHCAEDCTAIGRRMIQFAAEEFIRNDYEVLYGDTDSLYVALGSHSLEESQVLAKKIEEYLKGYMPFPNDDFGFRLDEIIKAIFFFPIIEHNSITYKKKNYIYVTNSGKVVIKGLPIIKSNSSKLSNSILTNYILTDISNKLTIKYHKEYLKQLIYYELSRDISMGAQVYKVRDANYYKIESALPAQISKKYGSGTIELIPNFKYGIGKGKKYCTPQEFREQNLKIEDIDLSMTWSCLDPFIKEEQTELNNFGVTIE